MSTFSRIVDTLTIKKLISRGIGPLELAVRHLVREQNNRT